MLRNTSRPSLQLFTALQRIQRDMAQSIIIHECGWYSKTHLGVRRVSQSVFLTQHIFSLLSKPHYSYQHHLLNPLPLHLVKLHPVNPLIVAKPFVLNIHGHQLEEHLVSLSFHSSFWYGIFPHHFFKTRSPKLRKLLIATSFLRWTVLTLRIRFLPGVLHSRPSTNRPLISSKPLRPCQTMATTHILIPVSSYTQRLHVNILSHGSEFVMLGSCVWQ